MIKKDVQRKKTMGRARRRANEEEPKSQRFAKVGRNNEVLLQTGQAIERAPEET